MRVLVIDEWIPLPQDSGKKIRTFQLLYPLAQRHELVYLCYTDRQQDSEKIAEMEAAGFQVLCVPPRWKFNTPLRLAAGWAANCLRAAPLAVRQHYSGRFQKTVCETLADGRFDLVHCEWTHYCQFWRGLDRVPRFVSAHNLECQPWERLYRTETSPLRRAALHVEWLKMRAFERRALAEADHVAAVSLADLELMKTWFGVPSVEVIPNGVDPRYYASPPSPNDGDVLAFCASMDAFTNQDAVVYFVERIFPKILQRRPSARFMIIGRAPPPAIRNLASDRIIVTGGVADVRPLLAKATVSVVPLRIGGGSRLKILESFAAGLPVVSTTVGAEGLEVEDGQHLVIADEETAFAEQTVRLLDDSARQQRLADAGRTLVEEKYAWSAIVPLVERAWERTIDNFLASRHQPRHTARNRGPRPRSAMEHAAQ